MNEKEHYRIEALKSLDFSKWEFDTDGVTDSGVDNFRSYFAAHYEPLLNKLADYEYSKIDLSEKEKRLLGFLRDDLEIIFKGE